jgi:Fe-S oxidoreductase
LSVGKIGEAKQEAERVLAALSPYVSRGVSVVGLEPSCLFTFRDELPALIKTDAARQLADNSFLFEEFLAQEQKAGRLSIPLKPLDKRALLHGHCHQKAFAAMGSVQAALKLVPGLEVETVESSCCGMAGAFGYKADTIDVSLKMGELSLLPAVRKADAGTLIVADGTSCRHQIHDGTGREAVHVARILAMSLDAAH